MQNIFILEDQIKGLELVKSLIDAVFGNADGDCPTILHRSKIRDVTHQDLAECDIAFIDLSLPDGYSFNVITQCKDINPDTPVIVTTLYSEDDLVFNALQSGADGYLLKGDGKENLTRCLNRILDGEPPISPQIARKLMGQFASEEADKKPTGFRKVSQSDRRSAKKALTVLSSREYEVLLFIAQGMVTKEIARKLSISAYTVSDIVKIIYKKLNINSRAQAATIAVKSGAMKKKN